MLEEIRQQPQILKKLADKFFATESNGAMGLNLSDDKISHISKIIIIASGSSKNVGDIAKVFFEELLGVLVVVEFSSEFIYRRQHFGPNDLVIAISQSGETIDTYKALEIAKKNGVHTVSLTNNPESKIHLCADSKIIISADKEKCVAATKTVTAQLLCMMALGIFLAEKRQTNLNFIDELKSSLLRLDVDITEIIEDLSIPLIADEIKKTSGIMLISRGVIVDALREGALKIKETSYIMTETIPSGEALHGHLAVLDEGKTLVSAVLKNCECYNLVLSNTEYLKQKCGPKLVVIKNQSDAEIEKAEALKGAYFINIPASNKYACAFYVIVACQLLAYYIASGLNFDTCNPRNLFKTVLSE